MALVSDFRQDVRYSIRTLFNDPGFAIVAVFALALGIGVNTGIFTLLNAVALRPLPVTEADQVVSVYQSFRGNMDRKVNGAISYFSYPEYLDYRDHNQVFSGLAASAHAVASLRGADARRVEGQVVSCNFFSVLGRPPLQGRQFSPEECSKPNAAPVVILSHAFWSNEFRRSQYCRVDDPTEPPRIHCNRN